MADRFETYSAGLTGPASRHFAITPANTDLAFRPRCLMVTATGDVVIQDELGVNVTYAAVPAYTLLPFRAVQVRTGTTATVVGWD